MNAEQLGEWLERHLPQVARLHLIPNHTRVSHVLNWGGFVNYSFAVDDGSRQYHLKLTDDLDSVGKMRAWHRVHSRLERQYRAPKVIDWMDFPEIGFAGMLQQHIDGKAADFCNSPALVEELIEWGNRLHADADLRSHLSTSGSEKTYLDHFVETYIDRFTADLGLVAEGHLPFASSVLIEWMWHETDRLRETAESVQAFHHPATEPVHGDLNEGNVLVTANDWFVLDWDDLALGDPAVDFAVLLWPIVYERGQWSGFSVPNENGFRQRMEICLRAQLLDEVIDPLADYVAAGAVPSKQDEVQVVKRKRHEEALQRYRAVWCP